MKTNFDKAQERYDNAEPPEAIWDGSEMRSVLNVDEVGMKNTDQVDYAAEQINHVLDNFDWHMTMPVPSLTVLMIEAKADLIRASRKLEKVTALLQKYEGEGE